ncbi:peptidyl-prolyl cis-trans isomerase [Neobacillus niacini]|uniref:peptidylprolyl isomerase n=1 Tax=Neobacillus niacini TaxID=86668 RepID=UPI0021CB3544|nr:peptidyl-prolyl cis-trans isomerase [Neobacillus niacini]MCM3768438.1 peptidyl-prolyl cis-trans isomerase [Neobacillus niacini]
MGKKQLWMVIAGLIMLNCVTIVFFLSKAGEVGGAAAEEAVATIGKKEITRQDWLHELETRYGKDVLRDLINQQVVQEMAKKEKIKISDQDVEREFRMLLATNHSVGPNSKLDEKKWKEQIRNNLLLEELLTKDVNISEKEVKSYYDKNKHLFDVPEAYHVSHILVRTKKEADAAYNELKQGSSFSALAMERSVDEFSANEGGDLGYITDGDEQYPRIYIDTAKKLKKGKYSKPVQVDNTYVLLKLEEKISGKKYSYEEVKSQIRRQIALEQMKTPASATTFWKEAKVDWFYGKTKDEN